MSAWSRGTVKLGLITIPTVVIVIGGKSPKRETRHVARLGKRNGNEKKMDLAKRARRYTKW